MTRRRMKNARDGGVGENRCLDLHMKYRWSILANNYRATQQHVAIHGIETDGG